MFLEERGGGEVERGSWDSGSLEMWAPRPHYCSPKTDAVIGCNRGAMLEKQKYSHLTPGRPYTHPTIILSFTFLYSGHPETKHTSVKIHAKMALWYLCTSVQCASINSNSRQNDLLDLFNGLISRSPLRRAFSYHDCLFSCIAVFSLTTM